METLKVGPAVIIVYKTGSYNMLKKFCPILYGIFYSHSQYGKGQDFLYTQ